MGIDDSINKGLRKVVTKKARQVIQKTIKQRRLVFIDKDTIEYTSKEGDKSKYNFLDMAEAFIDITGNRGYMAQIGMGESDIYAIILDEYNKSKKTDK